MQKFEITKAEGGTAFLVQVKPEAESNKIAGKDKDIVYVELTSASKQEPVNRDLAEFLADKLGLQPDRVAIASGSSVEKKIVIIMGLTPEQIEQRLFN